MCFEQTNLYEQMNALDLAELLGVSGFDGYTLLKDTWGWQGGRRQGSRLLKRNEAALNAISSQPAGCSPR